MNDLNDFKFVNRFVNKIHKFIDSLIWVLAKHTQRHQTNSFNSHTHPLYYPSQI